MNTDRWTEYKFSNGKVAKNRVVVPPMASQTADQAGCVTAATLKHYQKLSESQSGIIFVEYSFVHQSGKGEERQLGVHSDNNLPGLKCLAKVLHESGALAGLQIVHAGGKSDPEITGQALLGYLVEDAAMIKATTSLPVIGVGGIESGAAIDQMLALDKLDFAAVGRAILKNPFDWFQTNLAVNCSQAAV